jgi:hypothetical protein
MAKALVEVEIQDGYELAEVAMRSPVRGEYYWCPHWDSGPRKAECDYAFDAVILRPAWTWPAWLKAPWIAKDDGDPTWMAFESEPHLRLDAGVWWLAVGYPIYRPLYDFTPPPCTDWKLSKRKNPNL